MAKIVISTHYPTHAPLKCGNCQKVIKVGEKYKPRQGSYDLCLNCERPPRRKRQIASQHYALKYTPKKNWRFK